MEETDPYCNGKIHVVEILPYGMIVTATEFSETFFSIKVTNYHMDNTSKV